MNHGQILVLLESPYGSKDDAVVEANVEFARACARDCFMRGEYPFPSHILYTQKGILDDRIPEERAMGIAAGLAWGSYAAKTVVYLDRGMSSGMKLGITRAKEENRPIEYRYLNEDNDTGQDPESVWGV